MCLLEAIPEFDEGVGRKTGARHGVERYLISDLLFAFLAAALPPLARSILQQLMEFVEHIGGRTIERDLDKGQQPHLHPLGIQQRDIAVDEAVALQPPRALQAGRRA